jgi:hypothetical protein
VYPPSAIVPQQLQDHPEPCSAVDVGILPTGIVPSLHERHALLFQDAHLLRHVLDLEGDVVYSFAPRLQELLPGAGSTHRFDQL